eukprot:scaffold266703_cov36-Prasinocladus_malaysianus.AAC.1
MLQALQPLMADGQSGPGYLAAYKHFASQGGRVIALAFRRLAADMTTSDLRAITRQAALSRLNFRLTIDFSVRRVQLQTLSGYA